MFSQFVVVYLKFVTDIVHSTVAFLYQVRTTLSKITLIT